MTNPRPYFSTNPTLENPLKNFSSYLVKEGLKWVFEKIHFSKTHLGPSHLTRHRRHPSKTPFKNRFFGIRYPFAFSEWVAYNHRLWVPRSEIKGTLCQKRGS